MKKELPVKKAINSDISEVVVPKQSSEMNVTYTEVPSTGQIGRKVYLNHL